MLRPVFSLLLCRLSLAMVPLLATAVADEAIELPSNLSPALRQRLLAQNNVAQPEGVPALPTPAAPAAPTPAAPGVPVPATPAPVVPATPGAPDTAAPPARRPNITLPTRAGTPRPGAPGAPATPALAEPRPAPPDDPNTFLLAFTGNPIEEVLEEYQRISGRHVIRDLGLTGTVVVVQNPDVKMTKDEGVDFIKASLLIQGFSLQEYMKGIDKCIAITGKPPGLEGPIGGSPIYMSAKDLPETDEPVNYLIRLNYLSAADASQVFANAVPNHTWGAYVAVPSANAILVRGSIPNIRTLIKIKDEVDVEPVAQVHDFVELERASAEDIQALLDGILQAQTQASTASGGSGGFRPVAAQIAANALGGNNPNAGGVQPVIAGGPGTSTGIMPDGKSVIVKADPRTNRIFINGPKVHVEYLKKLVKEFDQPSRVKNLLTQQLRYIPVDEFIDIAVSSLEARGLGAAGQTAGGGAGGGGAGATGGARTTQTSGQNQFGGGTNRGGTGGFGGGGFGGGGFGGGGTGNRAGGAASSGGGLASRQSTAALPRSAVVGKTLLISDPRMNSLLVTGPPESIERVSELIKEMDKRPLQVHINAVIAQITLGDDITTGFDLLRRVEDVEIGGENVSIAGLYKTTGGSTFLDPANLDTIAGFTSAADGLNLYAGVGELFNAYVTALERTSRFKVLSKPHVATANNEIADIRVGSRVPIPANQQSSIVAGGTTSVTSNIEYEDVELVLEVRPLINSKNEITIEVNQINNTVAGSTLINGNQIPNILTQSLNNKITVPNGAIFTIGGSITETKTQNVTGLPFISKVPFIKHLFGTTTHKATRQELVIMIQPRIIDTANDMIDVHTSEVQRTVIGPEAENFAKPDRDTSNVLLPTYEKDIPFDAAGYPEGQRPVGKNLFKRIRDSIQAH
ncbi:MAG: secretin N-terminal domain-containing protein [Verrucomicrobiota bacterium]